MLVVYYQFYLLNGTTFRIFQYKKTKNNLFYKISQAIILVYM